jgi:hypothetical protein
MHTWLSSALTLVLLSGPAAGAERVDYLREIKPLLTARCYACHGGLKQKAKLRLDTAASIRQGGGDGPAIVPGDSAKSLLLERVTLKGKGRMPPENEGEALTEREITLLRTWIDQGATAPADEKAESDPKDHWAFRAPVRPAVPNISGISNPIDTFLVAEQAKRGLKAQPVVDKPLLLRRVTLDLIGLPPTREELAAFVADKAPDAYEKVVERLLASPQYGERWGRHWMDIWRYSDWWGLGAEVRNSQKHMWHWRDWIIESLNADKGYDQMIREMLAADELYPNDLDRLRATGFLARNYFRFNRTTWMDETIEHTSKAFLGLTLNCAKCHDHKYDPISQKDYYRLRAFFEPYQVRLDELPGETDLERDGLPRVFDCHLEAPTYRFVRGDEKRPLTDHPLTPGVPPLLSVGELEIQPVTLPAEARFPGLRPYVLENHLKAAEVHVATARGGFAQAKQTLANIEASRQVASVPLALIEEAQVTALIAEHTLKAAEAQLVALRARAAADRAREQSPPAADAAQLAQEAARAEAQLALTRAEADAARAELNLLRAEPAKQAELAKQRNAARDAVAKLRTAPVPTTYTPLRGSSKTPESPTETEASRLKPYPATSSGRRSALARWLTDARHPLTARVAVNYMWVRHFGQPLVPTVFDFGRKGRPPLHPALLDHLALELRDHNWSMKHVHRLMVTSQTYRLTSSSAGAAPANLADDPENRCYWRRDPVRMEAQVVRDSLLHLAGELDLKLGGPPIPLTDETSRRRSLYFVHSHNDHHRFLSVFDDASVLECYRRAESIVPQQALALSNSALALSMADRIAARLSQQLGNAVDTDFVPAAFEMTLGSRPTRAEQAECERALAQLLEVLKMNNQPDPSRRARASLVHALLNHNDFITIR